MAANSTFGGASIQPVNKLPKWKGFNFTDFYSPNPRPNRRRTKKDYFKWMQDWVFDFVRVPMAYPGYLKFDRSRNILPDEVRNIDEERTDEVEEFVYMCNKYNMHVSINLHRAPGYCVNAGFNEPYNLFYDDQALEDFLFHWEYWAKKFKNVSRGKVSFDLLNEPSLRDDMNDQHGRKDPIPGMMYRKIVEPALKVIKGVNPDHLVITDGNAKGRDVTPEIADLDVGQSCRGYVPAIISHYKAPWRFKDIDNLPEPKWPGQVGDEYLSREMLDELYKPWIDLVKQGVGVHCGECGCYNKTPHDIFLSWFGDVLGILSENGIGYALWNFSGAFGVLNSGREDVEYENWYGEKLERKLLDLLQKV